MESARRTGGNGGKNLAATGQSMVMEDNEQSAAPITEASAPQVAERPLWVLSRDEQRVLIITFAGGLASIVAGVGVVGGAIALVRGLRAIQFPLGYQIFFTTAYIFLAILGVSFRRRLRPLPRALLILWLALCVGLSIWLLALIGVAAGIH